MAGSEGLACEESGGVRERGSFIEWSTPRAPTKPCTRKPTRLTILLSTNPPSGESDKGKGRSGGRVREHACRVAAEPPGAAETTLICSTHRPSSLVKAPAAATGFLLHRAKFTTVSHYVSLVLCVIQGVEGLCAGRCRDEEGGHATPAPCSGVLAAVRPFYRRESGALDVFPISLADSCSQ